MSVPQILNEAPPVVPGCVKQEANNRSEVGLDYAQVVVLQREERVGVYCFGLAREVICSQRARVGNKNLWKPWSSGDDELLPTSSPLGSSRLAARNARFAERCNSSTAPGKPDSSTANATQTPRKKNVLDTSSMCGTRLGRPEVPGVIAIMFGKPGAKTPALPSHALAT
eukprot:CAMPEP_0117599774 /NCGR_PEP_ID=MMETSP0784-20121206/76127_1 /TAXON_ID=39447 /ORGANISM="" /LENGTH=168 /DNA_ID=CAMNT_0005402349 /DNA_START=329 /DNA_END=836 /DNA_ORIENTATION=+